MPQTVLITVTSIGVDNSSTFNIYSDLDNYINPFATGISATSLLSGYTSNNVPDGTIRIKLKSTSGVCDYEPVTGMTISVIPQPSHTPSPTPTITPTPTLTPTPAPTSTPTVTPTPTPLPITASYRYIATSNWGSVGSNTKTASNLCVSQNSVNRCVSNDTWASGNNQVYTLTGITVGTYPLIITRNLSQNTTFTAYTQTITGYTVDVLVNSVSVWSTGYTYTPALTIPVTPSVDAQSITTSGITLNGGENVEIIWTDNCYSPNIPTPTPTPTPTVTPTPTINTFNLTPVINLSPVTLTGTCSYDFVIEYSLDSGTTYNTLASNAMQGTGSAIYSGSTISLTPGTYNGLRVRRSMCKRSGCGTSTVTSTEAFVNISFVAGGLVNSSSNTGDQNLPTCPTNILRTLTFTSTTFTAGENYRLTWNEVF